MTVVSHSAALSPVDGEAAVRLAFNVGAGVPACPSSQRVTINSELVAATSPDSPLHEHPARHGEGFFRLAFGVDDGDETYERPGAAGVPMKDPPCRACKDWCIACLDSSGTGGITAAHVIAADAD